MKLKNYFFVLLAMLLAGTVNAQDQTVVGPGNTGMLAAPLDVPSIAEQIRNGTFKPADNTQRLGKPKRQRVNNIVPGKGSAGVDEAVQTGVETRQGKAPSLVFEADISQSTPSDPTGAVGPAHYVGGWNVAFRIFDLAGNPLTPEASLGTIFPGNAIGDPIIFFDPYIENAPGEPRGRFVITEFDQAPNGFNVAVCKGPDPVNDGWWVYTTGFGTGSFPDYTKFSVWSDAYYVTANISAANRTFAVEREKMAAGEPAQFIGFPLPGIATSGFYSPHGFSATGGSEPELGNFSVVYLQDDAWGGVADDHLKIWTINVDWETPGNSTISTAQQLITTDFISVFDGGSFANLDQPAGPDIDALQATVMNQAQFRMFDGYNSALLNFVVDTDPGGGELAGVRWYELRQPEQGQPWTIFQEGTYLTPTAGRHAFSGSMAMDIQGNIGMAYSSVSTAERISIRYTGRLSTDPLNTMPIAEELIGLSSANSPTTRFADYVHLSTSPTDDKTFWHIAEYFNPNRRNVVGVFEHAVNIANDVAVINLSPNTGVLGSAETITVEIQNYGTATQTVIPVTYSVDGGTPVAEVYTGSIAAGATDTFTFTATADLSTLGQTYRIETRTNLPTDNFTPNDVYGENVRNDGVLSTESLEIGNAEMIVTSSDNKHFVILLTTSYDKILPISVYDINGKLLAFNNLEKQGQKYRYELDMSYVASGVYLVKMGSDSLEKTAKIIVK